MTPLVLITGFLGAGKTTLLRELLPRLGAAGVVPRVIINDYQNAYVDAAQLREHAERVVPISGTCVCCGSRDDLLDALRSLPAAPRDIVLLEANGTADTVELIELLSGDRRAAAFSLPVQLAVVDAKRWQKRHWNNALEAGQVSTAGYVLMTRRDEVTDARWCDVASGVCDVNPRAAILDAAAAEGMIVDLVRDAPDLPPRRFASAAERPRPDHDHHHFASMELRLAPRVTREALDTFLCALPPEVIRAKGVAFLEGEPAAAVLFQRVGESVDVMKLGAPDGLDPVCVIVGSRLPEEQILRAAAGVSDTRRPQ